jgi:Zinc finger, C2H2 type
MDSKICISCLVEDKNIRKLTTQSSPNTFEAYKLCSGITDTDELFLIDGQAQVCEICLTRLMAAYDFRLQCQTSLATLKEREQRLHEVKEEHEMWEAEPLEVEHLVIEDTETQNEPADDKRSIESADTMEAEFMCYYCDAILSTYSDYIVHREKHIMENTTVAKARGISRVCSLCDQFQVSFVKHLESVHKDFYPNKCLRCRKAFRTPKLLKAHLFKHLETENFPCLGCQRTFKSHSQRRSHLKLVKHEKGVYRCCVCGLGCEKFIALHQHFQKEHKTQNTKQLFPCFDCRDVFSYIKHFQQHKCPDSGKRRKNVDQLPLTASIYPCDRCGQRFADEDEMVCHKFTVCSARSQCPECGKVLENRHVLQNHLRRHELAGAFICEICAFSACSAPKLALHMTKHKPEDRNAYLECPYPGCLTKLKSDYTLQVHMRRHDEAKYECYLCLRKFRSRSEIQRHMTTEHIPAEQLGHICHCGKRFYTARELRIHSRLHNGE